MTKPTDTPMTFTTPAKKFRLLTALALGSTLLSACQTLPKTTPTVVQSPDAPIAFNISGKIGMTQVAQDGTQSGTVFYSWVQNGERFNIDLAGALGLGATAISFDGTTATLENGRVGTLHADTPEELLWRATGWQAPISQLPHWIVGRSTPSDQNQQYNTSGQLVSATNGEWTAVFDYKGTLPNRLNITHTDGHRVIMTISHD